MKQWGKFTVKYSMKRFLETGGGTLVITIKGEKCLAVITNKKINLRQTDKKTKTKKQANMQVFYKYRRHRTQMF